MTYIVVTILHTLARGVLNKLRRMLSIKTIEKINYFFLLTRSDREQQVCVYVLIPVRRIKQSYEVIILLPFLVNVVYRGVAMGRLGGSLIQPRAPQSPRAPLGLVPLILIQRITTVIFSNILA